MLAHIRKQRGGHFDPKIVDLFLEQGIRGVGAAGGTPLAREIPVSVSQLRPGMVLARDLRSASGLVMLAKDTLLQESIVIRLQGMQDDRAVAEPIFVRVEVSPGEDAGERA